MTNKDDQKTETTHSLALPGEWALRKILGPTLDEVGVELASLYRKGIEKISKAAARKVKNVDDSKIANLRTARDIFWNGGFTDDDVCAEYFGGILAASRSDDGRDDAGIYYVDIIKSLSAKQLHLHYIIYYALNKKLVDGKIEINSAMGSEVSEKKLYFSSQEIADLGIDIATCSFALNSKGLIGGFESDNKKIKLTDTGEEIEAHIYEVRPTPLGIQLFCIINNDLNNWLSYNKNIYQKAKNITLPNRFALDRDELFMKVSK